MEESGNHFQVVDDVGGSVLLSNDAGQVVLVDEHCLHMLLLAERLAQLKNATVVLGLEPVQVHLLLLHLRLKRGAGQLIHDRAGMSRGKPRKHGFCKLGNICFELM